MAKKRPKNPPAKKRRKNPHALPAYATAEERTLALFSRLYPGHRQSRVSPALLIAVCMPLALKQPEFSRGSGAKKGSKHKDRKPDAELTEASRHKREQRANNELTNRTILIAGEVLELEDGVDVDLVKSALASIERQKK
jgi:hypothetical protein